MPGTGVQTFRSFDILELDKMDGMILEHNAGDQWLDYYNALDISYSERIALHNYAELTYRKTNAVLRSGGMSLLSNNRDAHRMVQQIDDVLDRSAVPEDVTTYRGTYSKDWSSNLKVGDVYIDNGLVSTSLGKNVANDFGGLTGTMVEIEVPKGSRGFYMPSLGSTMGAFMLEHELLLPRGSMFQVISNRKEHVVVGSDSYASYVLRVRYIGVAPKEPAVHKGGPGSGHRDHVGRPGKRGGSLPGSGTSYTVYNAAQLESILIGDMSDATVAYWDSVYNDMSYEELDALRAYVDRGYYEPVNMWLRHNNLPSSYDEPEIVSEINDLDSALSSPGAVLNENVVLFRGTPSGNAIDTYVAGSDVIDRGFVSTTLDNNLANSFARGESGGIVFRIEAPAGSRGLMVSQEYVPSEFGTEYEVILPRNAIFHVTKVIHNAFGVNRHIVHMKYIGVEPVQQQV